MALFQRIKTPFVEPEPEPEPRLAAGPRSAGDALRQRREVLGLDLGQCAGALKIKPEFLAALEDGRPDRLPGATYAIGFVRAYGDYLGLDSHELLRRFKAESAGLDAKPDLSFPMPLGERSVPGGGMLLVALILAICGYGTWYYLSTAQRARPQRVGEVPLALLAPTPKPPVPAEIPAPAKPAAPNIAANAQSPPATPPQPQPAEPAALVPAAPSVAAASRSPAAAAPAAAPLVSGMTAATPPSVAASPPPPAPPPALSPAPQTAGGHSFGAVEGSVRIVIRATADSWIQVRDPDQGVVFTRTLKAGESYRVPDRTGLSMRTGNAGGLDIEVDGHPAPSIGKSGVLRRDVALEPQALATGVAVHD